MTMTRDERIYEAAYRAARVFRKLNEMFSRMYADAPLLPLRPIIEDIT